MGPGDAAVLDVRPLLPRERRALVELLTSLSPPEWLTPTACPGWTVKDVALHLLDDELGWLSRGRDGDLSGLIDDRIDYREFVEQLAAKNQRWIDGATGLSPRVITELLRVVRNRGRRLLRRRRPRRRAPRHLGRAGARPPVVRPGPRLHRTMGAPPTDPRRVGPAGGGRRRAHGRGDAHVPVGTAPSLPRRRGRRRHHAGGVDQRSRRGRLGSGSPGGWLGAARG